MRNRQAFAALCVLWAAWMAVTVAGQQPCSNLLSDNLHSTGLWRSKLNLPVSKPVTRWQATIKFSQPILQFSTSKAQFSSSDKRIFLLQAFPSQLALRENTVLVVDFQATLPESLGSSLSIESVHFDGTLVCSTASPLHNRLQQSQSQSEPPKKRRLKYDYALAIEKSNLFFEAQRSGLLPMDNKVSWRGDSCLNDVGAQYEDLTAGYYTNGRTLKFTFPTAAAMTILAWGIINREGDGYKIVGQYEVARDALNWGVSYLVKCHTKEKELYVLVGDVNKEINEWWGRPEDITFARPAFAVTTTNPGSEVAAETAAALAAAAAAFADKSEDKLSYLNHAKQLYNFAKNYRGDYSKAVPQVAEHYKSWSGDEDELVWAALWLHRATGQPNYLNEAKSMYDSFKLGEKQVGEFSWDDKTLGCRVLLASYTADEKYETEAKNACNSLALNTTLRNPQGLFLTDYHSVGIIRYAANLAFVCHELGEVLIINRGISRNPYIDFAVRQVNFILGDTGRSFMVGFGQNPPQRIIHSASSCPNIPAPCGWQNKNALGPNPQIVHGALVGGPDKNGKYEDTRDNWAQNDVGIDYNAGFQSLLASLVSLDKLGKLPNLAYEGTYGR